MKRLIKYCAILFALVLATSIISSCILAGITVVKQIVKHTGEGDAYRTDIVTKEEDGGLYLFGFRIGDVETKTGVYRGENVQNIKSLYVESMAGNLIIEKGRELTVAYENIPEDYVIEVVQGTLMIQREKSVFVFNSLFQETPKITVTVPQDMVFTNVMVDKGSGTAEISDITSKRTVFDTGSGTLTVRDSDLGETEVNSGSGFVTFEDVTAENMIVDSGSGRIKYEGVLTGNCVFDTGSGSVSLDIYGEAVDYNIHADLGSGGLYVNGRKAEENIEYKGAENSLIFDTGSGRVSVKYHDAR